MHEIRFGSNYSTEPRYNTKVIVRETGVPADTFRAWERRYGAPMPHRLATGQRLYSERDIAIIRWLRDRTAEGLTISQAVRLLEQNGAADEAKIGPASWASLEQQLVTALLRLDAPAAEAVLNQAFATYSLDEVCLKLIAAALVTIGEGWHAGSVSVGQEHFATQLLRRKLQALFSVYDIVAGHGTVVTACAPGEQHDVGLLMLALLLVRRGYRVVYLGADLPADGLLQIVQQVNPDLVCLSTATAATAPAAKQVADALNGLPHPPCVVIGGGGLSADEPESTSYIPISGDAHIAVDQIVALSIENRRATGEE